jgi:hypothetical protein
VHCAGFLSALLAASETRHGVKTRDSAFNRDGAFNLEWDNG